MKVFGLVSGMVWTLGSIFRATQSPEQSNLKTKIKTFYLCLSLSLLYLSLSAYCLVKFTRNLMSRSAEQNVLSNFNVKNIVLEIIRLGLRLGGERHS